MRILGLDVGDRTIGVAVSDELGWTARGLEVIRRSSWKEDSQHLRRLCENYNVGLVVVGFRRI